MYKILIFGDYISQIHEIPIGNALLEKGHIVKNFSTNGYKKYKLLNRFYNLQIKLGFGPLIWKINKNLIKEVERNNYDLLFLYRPIFIKRKTLKHIRNKCLIFCYNNDDPFSNLYKNSFWKDFFNCLIFYDHIFYYRKKNELDYKKIGYTNTSLLRSYYIQTLNYKISNVQENKFNSDVVFIGHFEDDGRDLKLKKIIESGIKIKIFGPDWQRSKYFNYFTEKLGYKITSLNSTDYNLALNSSKIALVFLSTLNNDTYTRRCFEIPASQTLMLSQYSDDLNDLFIDGKEAVYFHTINDLISKIIYYLHANDERDLIVQNAYRKLLISRHEVSNRVDEILEKIDFYNHKL